MTAVFAIFAASAAIASSAIHLGGVRAYGRVHSVSRSDIREAMTTGIGVTRKASEVEVISSREMHVYLRPRGLGWIPVRRNETFQRDAEKWSGEVIGFDDPSVSRAIRKASEVYVFPVSKPLRPSVDDKHLRIIGGEARGEVTRLLADKRNWWQGGYSIPVIDDGSRGIGLLFRGGGDEVVIFTSDLIDQEGTFNGRHVIGLLDDRRGRPKMKQWIQKYARHELATK